MTWGFIWLMVILKVPIAALIYLVWWAVRQEPEQPGTDSGGDGGSKVPHPRPPLPRTPRRGPHGDPMPSAPPRVRSVTARGRALEHV
jgi:hypothetical protein